MSTRETIFTDLWRQPVARYVDPEAAPGVERIQLAPGLAPTFAVVITATVVVTAVLALATALPSWVIIPLAIVAAQLVNYRYARWWAKTEAGHRMRELANDRARERTAERGALSEAEFERLTLLRAAREAALPWIDYDSGEIWPSSDARLTSAIEALKAKRDAPPAEPEQKTLYKGRATGRAYRYREPTRVVRPDMDGWVEIHEASSAGPVGWIERPSGISLDPEALEEMRQRAIEALRAPGAFPAAPEPRPVPVVRADLEQLRFDLEMGRLDASAARSLRAELTAEYDRARAWALRRGEER